MSQYPWHVDGVTLKRQWRVTTIGLAIVWLLRLMF